MQELTRVSENVHSDARRNLRRKVVVVLKKGQSFYIKDGVLGGQVSQTIHDTFQ